MKLAATATAALLAAVIGLAGCSDELDPACSAPSGQRCAGNTVVTCVGEEVTREDCGGAQPECGYVDSVSGFACVAEACALVGPLGRCVGDTLERCTGSELTATTCADGQVCAYLDDVMGHGCRAAMEPMSVSGEIRYEDRPQTGSGGLGSVQLLPVRGATVTVIDETTAQVLATTITADNGSYVARFTAAAGTMVHVTAVARSTFRGRPISVTVGSQMAVHGFGSPAFPADAASTLDLVITAATSGTAEAFNVFDQTVMSMDVIRRDFGIANPVTLRLRWARNSNDGTYFDGTSIHLLGAASDDDGYDDTVIQHEIGHYIERTIGRSDSPGGGHNGSPTDPRLAWSEGYATYWAQSVLGHPVYSDSNSGGGWSENLDTGSTQANGSGLTQPVSESMVSQILWDLGDGGAGDDDMLSSSSHAEVNNVQKAYLDMTALRAVGTAGVDLVDFLDGWFVTRGLATCAAARDIVVTKHNFPYDFAGPAGACP